MKRSQVVFFGFCLMALSLLVSCGGKVTIVNPTVEMQDGRQPLATAQPRFSWQYRSELKNVVQVDYRIIVSSSAQKAREGIGDLWDSEVVKSSDMLYIPYQGKALKSREEAWWKVCATVTYGDKGKKKRLESRVQHFEISLLSPDDWHAHWIGRDFDDDTLEGHTSIAARYLRTEFPLKSNIKRARLYISGLGVYRAFINGQEVAPDELLKPALSDYTQRIYFNAYDVTDLLFISGKPTGVPELAKEANTVMNAIGVILGPGRFTTIRHHEGYLEWCGIHHAVHYGLPQLLLQLEVTYSDGTTDTIVSGEGWKITNCGAIRKSNEFDGETYDENFSLGLRAWLHPGCDDSWWMPVVVDYDKLNMNQEERFNPRYRYEGREYQPPQPELTPQPNPNLCVQQIIKPVAIFPKGDTWILDMGQNMVGVLEINNMGTLLARKTAPRDTLVFRYAETLNADSTLYTDNLRSAECTDRYIAVGRWDVWWHPSFVYHGFRYVEISGLPKGSRPTLEDFCGLVIYDRMATTGTLETSSPVINAVHHNAFWGIRGNYRSMPTDCPQRDERMGWTGDRTTGCYGESYLFDNHRLYAKWLQDLEDCQWQNGQLSDVAPAYWRNYTDNMTWPGAFITVADMLYTRYGDLAPIARHYDAMRLWMLHMKERYMVDGILTRDTYGDWCMPPESLELIHSKDPSRLTGAACISTPFYCYLAGKMARFAQLLGRDADVALWQADIATVTTAYNAQYLDTAKGCYANNTVTANILPLAFDMVPTELEYKVFSNIVDKTLNDFGGHVSTGVVGIQQLMRTLTDHGRGDLALRLATNETYPSWGYMARNGATTIWELWNGNTADPSMNSGNHVMLLGDLIIWYYEYLGGIRTGGSQDFQTIVLKPHPIAGLDHVNCSYQSVMGQIVSNWRRNGSHFEWDFTIPANTKAQVYLPTQEGYHVHLYGSGTHHLTSTISPIPTPTDK